MKCPVCQQEIRDDARFCTACGVKIEVAPDPQIVSDVVPESVIVPETEITPEPEVMAEEPEVIAESVVEEEPAPQPQPEPAPQPKYEYVPQAPVTQPRFVYTQQAPAYQNTYQPVYQQTYTSHRPAYQLPDGRSLLKMIFLGLITFGIYNMVIMSRVAEEVNIVAGRHDGKRTQQFMWVSVLAGLTLGIYPLVWMHGLCNRIGDHLKRRGIAYNFSASDFWIWNFLVSIIGGFVIGIVLGFVIRTGVGMTVVILLYIASAVISAIGPFIFTHKFCKASNLMNRDYNMNG